MAGRWHGYLESIYQIASNTKDLLGPVENLTEKQAEYDVEYVTVDKYAADIHIYYKLLDKPLKDKRMLDIAIIK